MFINNIKNKYIILILSIIILFCLVYVLYEDTTNANGVKKEYLNNNIQMIKNINPMDTTFSDVKYSTISDPTPNVTLTLRPFP